MKMNLLFKVFFGGSLFLYLPSHIRSEIMDLHSGPYLTTKSKFVDHSSVKFLWEFANANSAIQVRSEIASPEFFQALNPNATEVESFRIHLTIENPSDEARSVMRFSLEFSESLNYKIVPLIRRYIDLRQSGFSAEFSIRLIQKLGEEKIRNTQIADRRGVAIQVFGSGAKEASHYLVHRVNPFLELNDYDSAFYVIDGEITWFLIFSDVYDNIFGADTDQVFDERIWNRIHDISPTFSSKPKGIESLIEIGVQLEPDLGRIWATPFARRPLWMIEYINELKREIKK